MWQTELILSRYYLSLAKKFLENYETFGEKKFLSMSMQNLSLSCRHFIDSTLQKNKIKTQNKLAAFPKILKKYLNHSLAQKIIKTLQLSKIQKKSSVFYLKEDKIIFLEDSGYKILSKDELLNFSKQMEKAIEVLAGR